MSTAALAARFALPAAAERPVPRAQQFHGVYRELGVYGVRYGVADGADAREVTAEEYAALVKDGLCQPTSHMSVWKASKAVTLVCETGRDERAPLSRGPFEASRYGFPINPAERPFP